MSTYPVNVEQAGQEAPLSYSPPDIAEVEAIAAFARFDGSAAASAFLPSLAFYSDGGLLLARVFPSDTVEAGDAADVTFGPFLGDDGGLRRFAMANVSSSGPTTIAAFDTVNLPFASFYTTDPAVFATGDYATQTINNQVGDDGLFLRKRGLYIVQSTWLAEIGVALESFQGSSWVGAPQTVNTIADYARSNGGTTQAVHQGITVIDAVNEDDPIDTWVGPLEVVNRTGAAIDITGGAMRVWYLPLRANAVQVIY